MRKLFFALGFLIFVATGVKGQEVSEPAPTPEENPAGNAGALKAQIQTGGSYDANSGNGTRIVNDLHVPGALGDYGLDFTRYWNSTHNDLDYPDGEWPLDFGPSGWSHSWHWHADYITYSEMPGDGGLEAFYTYIIITFPDGHMTKFHLVRANRPLGIPHHMFPGYASGPPYSPSEIELGWPDSGGTGIHDHLTKMDVMGADFWLALADGGTVHFINDSTHGYQAREVFDPHGLKTDLYYNAHGDLYSIAQEGGRSLNLTWGTFPGNSPVITQVETAGANGGSQHVTYKYTRQNSYSYVLTRVNYYDDPAPGQTSYAVYTYGTCYGDGTEPCDITGATPPMLKTADDPHYEGPMTRIRYNYAGTLCLPHLVHPEMVPDWVAGQPYRVAAEKSETGAVVSEFLLNCDTGERQEINGLGGYRRFYFGMAAQTMESTAWPDPSTDHYKCTGYQIGKITDFINHYVPMGLPLPSDVPCHRQNFYAGIPRHIWDGRNIETVEMPPAAGGDDSGLPYRINYPDGSNSIDDRVTRGDSDPLDDSFMHNTYNHWLFNKTDERGQLTTYKRDGRRRVIEIRYPDTSTESFDYTAFNQVWHHTLPSGAIETYEYDPNTHLLMAESNTVDHSEARKEYAYYGANDHPEWTGLVRTMTDGRARINGAPFTVRMTYNGRLKVMSVEYAPNNGTYPTVRYEYDRYGNCTAVTDEMGHRREYTYDCYRRCTSYTEPLNSPGPNCTNVASRRWDWVYDRVIDNGDGTFGNTISASAHTSKDWRAEVQPAFNANGERRATSRAFDVNNRITFEETGLIQPPGVISPSNPWHTGPDTETHHIAYDENGRKNRYEDPKKRKTTYDYDIRNRLWKTNEYPIAPGDPTTPLTTETRYNPAGDKILVIFPDNKTQEWPDLNYDAFGQPHLFIDEYQKTTDMDYWAWGPMKKLRTVTTHRTTSDGPENQVTTFDYDGMGRPQWTIFPDTTTELSVYEFGQLSAFKTRRDQTKRLHYDVRGREDWHTWDGQVAPGVNRQWDAANRLTSISNVFSAIDFGVDDAGQMKWEKSLVAGTGQRQVSYCRYPSGEVAGITYPDGQTAVQRAYTARGQLESATWSGGKVSYAYLADGKLDHEDYGSPAKTTTVLGYNGRGMISSVQHKNNATGHNLAYRDYWRDPYRDRITAWKRGTDSNLNGMEDGRGDRYGYDWKGQLTVASYRATNPETENPGTPYRIDNFQYDELGNRHGSNYLASRGPMDFTVRPDNRLNQYLIWSPYSFVYHDDNIPPPNPPDPNFPWVHPGNGVLMQDGWITAAYNALNQPICMWSSMYQGGSSANWMWFGYDPLGRCVKRWVGPAAGTAPNQHAPPENTNPATYYYYDGWNMVEEGPSGGTDRIYVHGGRIDEIVASQAGGVWSYHQYDAQGNCILLTDTNGGIREQYDYDAFGMPYVYNAAGAKIGGSVQWGNRFLFTGREWIKDMKLYDYRNRMYQPELGRFLQPDPKQFEAGDYNLYRFCHNDPVNKTDPTGLYDLNIFPRDDIMAKWGDKTPISSDRFTVGGHGAPDHMIDSNGNEISVQKLAALIQANPKYDPTKPVELYACSVGKDRHDGTLSFAQRLANELGSEVKAPISDITLDEDGKQEKNPKDFKMLWSFKPKDAGPKEIKHDISY